MEIDKPKPEIETETEVTSNTDLSEAVSKLITDKAEDGYPTNTPQKPKPPKAKKRKKPKDVTAPRQPLTGNISLTSSFNFISTQFCRICQVFE